ncbi:MAG: PKD domain-containing protein [Hymenobacter sp.]
MFSSTRKIGLVLAGAAALAACRKEGATSLEGPIPTPGFTVSLNTTQFPVVATFTNTTADAFLYQWDFGDGSPLASGQNVTHTYKLPDTYRVKLTAAGRGGSSSSPQMPVVIPSICGNAGYAVLTACRRHRRYFLDALGPAGGGGEALGQRGGAFHFARAQCLPA